VYVGRGLLIGCGREGDLLVKVKNHLQRGANSERQETLADEGGAESDKVG